MERLAMLAMIMDRQFFEAQRTMVKGDLTTKQWEDLVEDWIPVLDVGMRDLKSMLEDVETPEPLTKTLVIKSLVKKCILMDAMTKAVIIAAVGAEWLDREVE